MRFAVGNRRSSVRRVGRYCSWQYLERDFVAINRHQHIEDREQSELERRNIRPGLVFLVCLGVCLDLLEFWIQKKFLIDMSVNSNEL